MLDGRGEFRSGTERVLATAGGAPTILSASIDAEFENVTVLAPTRDGSALGPRGLGRATWPSSQERSARDLQQRYARVGRPRLALRRFPATVVRHLLADLAGRSQRQARVVHLRLFEGLTLEATARRLGLSTETVERDWRFARAWLARRLARPPADSAETASAAASAAASGRRGVDA